MSFTQSFRNSSHLFLAAAVLAAVSAAAQTPAPATPAPAAGNAAASTPAPVTITGTKVGAINMEGAIFNTNEGQREMQALVKKFEPKQAELKSQNDELEGLKKQLSTQQDKLNEDALASLKKQIEAKQKSFDRSAQDAQEEFGGQQQEIAGKILQKMAPLIVKFAQENGFGMVIDTSKPWPQGPVLISGENVDITKGVVDAFNAQSGVAAPAATGAAAKPAAPKPSAANAGAKPAAPAKTDVTK
jgi:outer membrane protein